jgi:hypothetical protein
MNDTNIIGRAFLASGFHMLERRVEFTTTRNRGCRCDVCLLDVRRIFLINRGARAAAIEWDSSRD